MPTLGDLYVCLKRQPESQGRRIVTALELYVTGSLNDFNHHTSVQLNNRLVRQVLVFKLHVADSVGVRPVSYTHLDVYKRQV